MFLNFQYNNIQLQIMLQRLRSLRYKNLISSFRRICRINTTKLFYSKSKMNLKTSIPTFKTTYQIKGEIEQLNNAASYFFTKEGKLVRPFLNLLYYNILAQPENQIVRQQQMDWAAVIEMLHVASLIHDDILDNSDMRRGLTASHIVFGKRGATFSANYLIGRAGRKIAEFENIKLFQIYSNIMDNLTNGEYLQALKLKKYSNQELTLNSYMAKTYYKTASLIANSLRGVCELAGITNILFQDLSFRIGLHLGMAFQLIDDILDYTSDLDNLGKSTLSDLKSGVVTGPVLFEYFSWPQDTEQFRLIDKVLHSKKPCIEESNQGNCDAPLQKFKIVNQLVLQGIGLQRTKYLAYLHAQEVILLLEQGHLSAQTDEHKALVSMIYYILSRKK